MEHGLEEIQDIRLKTPDIRLKTQDILLRECLGAQASLPAIQKRIFIIALKMGFYKSRMTRIDELREYGTEFV